MATIKLEIKSCRECPFHETKPAPAEDSWERPEHWFCKKSPKKDGTFREIAHYVDWNDKIDVPTWCPIKEK